MITGVVTPDLEVIVGLVVRGSGGREREIEAVVDTGFDGHLSLPPSLIRQLRLPWRRSDPLTT